MGRDGHCGNEVETLRQCARGIRKRSTASPIISSIQDFTLVDANYDGAKF